MRTEDNPQAFLQEEVNAVAFQLQPYHWPTIGWMEDIRRFTALPGNAGEACRLRLRFQALRKYASTYTRALTNLASQSGDGRLHCSWHQTGTDTSRFSSAGPNLQNLPASERQALPWLANLPDIRARFVAKPGYVFVVRDLSQIELRLAAHYSGDPSLLKLYREGGDVHANTMARVGCDRRNAKVAIFSILYEITPRTLARKLSLATDDWSITSDDAQRLIDGIYEAYPRLRDMQDRLAELGRQQGYAKTLTGFRRPIPESAWRGPEWKVAHTRRVAINTVIQGSAGGIMKRIMRALYEKCPGGCGSHGRILAQVHDELLVEVPEEFAEMVNTDLARTMASAAPELLVPLDSSGGIGKSWSEAKGG